MNIKKCLQFRVGSWKIDFGLFLSLVRSKGARPVSPVLQVGRFVTNRVDLLDRILISNPAATHSVNFTLCKTHCEFLSQSQKSSSWICLLEIFQVTNFTKVPSFQPAKHTHGIMYSVHCTHCVASLQKSIENLNLKSKSNQTCPDLGSTVDLHPNEPTAFESLN